MLNQLEPPIRWCYLLKSLLHLVRGELLLVHPPVLPRVQPVEGLVVFKVLTQSLQEKSELPEFDEVWTMLIGSFGHVLDVVETLVDGRDGIEQFINRNHVTDSLK